jgi:hypothetical protein
VNSSEIIVEAISKKKHRIDANRNGPIKKRNYVGKDLK